MVYGPTSFHIIYGLFPTITAECVTRTMIHKTKNIYCLAFKEKLANPCSRKCRKTYRLTIDDGGGGGGGSNRNSGVY